MMVTNNMSERVSYVNGAFLPHSKAYVHIEDRGYLFSDGVYEVFEIRQGIILNFEHHMARLVRSLNGLKIHYAVKQTEIHVLALQLLSHNMLGDAVVYLQISRGVAPRGHAFPVPEVIPSVIMTIIELPRNTSQEYEQGVRAITCPDMRWKRRDLKTISLLPNILAKEEAAQHKAAEAILIEDDQTVTEGSSTNLFIVDDARVIRTHPANGAILGGVTRQNLIVLAHSTGLIVREEPFSLSDLLKAKEVFLTSTTKHVLPITMINDVMIGEGKVGEITRQLMALYEAFIEGQLYMQDAVSHAG